jgi:hypothetical protein
MGLINSKLRSYQMGKRVLTVFAAFMFLFSIAGQAAAFFEEGHLIRVVYDREGVKEVVTDLGAGLNLRSPSSETMHFISHNFNLSQLGRSTWDNTYVAYFAYTQASGITGQLNGAWTSGPDSGQSSTARSWQRFLGGAQNIYAMNMLQHSAQNVNLQSDPQSYASKYYKYGTFTGFSSAENGDQNLAALATTGYVDQYLYYYSTPSLALPGVAVYQIRTYADGTTEINPAGAPSDTTPPTGTLSINGGAADTSTPTVTLNVTCTDDSGACYQMQFSNNPADSWSAPEAFASTKTWTLSGGDGEKTVHARFTDPSANQSEVYPDSINLVQGTPPGDVNISGEVDIADAVLAIRLLSGKNPGTEDLTGADVNGDGQIGAAEAVYILQKLAELR